MGIVGGERHDYHLQSGDDPAKWWERKDVINVNLYLAALQAEERDAWVSEPLCTLRLLLCRFPLVLAHALRARARALSLSPRPLTLFLVVCRLQFHARSRGQRNARGDQLSRQEYRGQAR